MTAHQSETWLAALSIFEARLVNRVILQAACSDDPFPDLGKLMLACEKLRREAAGTVPEGGVKKLGGSALERLAAALEIEI